MADKPLLDGTGRAIDYLRISVTDRCNLRCTYCMPPQGVPPLPHDAVLSYEEIVRLAGIFAALGVRHIRLTGGEPLVRADLAALVYALKQVAGIETVSITTNGILLEEQLPALLAAGLDGVNVSLDAMDPAVFARIARADGLASVLRGIDAVCRAPALKCKVNCVPTAENLGQLVPLAELARTRNLSVRFIELMPIGLGRNVPHPDEAAVRALLEEAYGPLSPCSRSDGHGPCTYAALTGFRGKIGFISALSHRFCDTCNRVRLTSVGFFKPCLQYEQGADLRPLLRGTDEEISGAILAAISQKPLHHRFSDPPTAGDETCVMAQIGG